jgi:hypothetical protein
MKLLIPYSPIIKVDGSSGCGLLDCDKADANLNLNS